MGTLALSVLFAASAAAHVTVNPGGVEKGRFAKLTFRVPNESSTAKLEIAFPKARASPPG